MQSQGTQMQMPLIINQVQKRCASYEQSPFANIHYSNLSSMGLSVTNVYCSILPRYLTGTDLFDCVFALLLLLLSCQLLQRVHSVYFGPLSNIPGPKLAASTYWYEFYYDVYKQGLYWREVDRLHGEYGAAHLPILLDLKLLTVLLLPLEAQSSVSIRTRCILKTLSTMVQFTTISVNGTRMKGLLDSSSVWAQ